MSFSPTYFTIEDVKPWLYGKVTFGTDVSNSMTDDLLNTICAFAESEVLNDLNPFYDVPLESKTTNDYEGLPSYTKTFLTRLFITKSVNFVLVEDFGQKSAVLSSDYAENMEKQYAKTMSRITSKDPKTGQFRYAPLPDLKINVANWTGLKIVPTPGVTRGPRGLRNNMGYAIRQITTPANSWWDFGDGSGPRNCTNPCDE